MPLLIIKWMNPKNALSNRGILIPSNTWFLGPTQVSLRNGISTGTATFEWLTNRQTHTQTDRPCYSVCSNRPLSLAIATMRPKTIFSNYDKHHLCCNGEFCDSSTSKKHTDLPTNSYVKLKGLSKLHTSHTNLDLNLPKFNHQLVGV